MRSELGLKLNLPRRLVNEHSLISFSSCPDCYHLSAYPFMHTAMAADSEQPVARALAVKRTFTIIGAIVIAEPFAATILFPFIYLMIRDFGTVHERYVGFWAGLISNGSIYVAVI